MKKLKSLLIIIINLLVTFLSISAIFSQTAISFSLLVAGVLILSFIAVELKKKL